MIITKEIAERLKRSIIRFGNKKIKFKRGVRMAEKNYGLYIVLIVVVVAVIGLVKVLFTGDQVQINANDLTGNALKMTTLDKKKIQAGMNNYQPQNNINPSQPFTATDDIAGRRQFTATDDISGRQQLADRRQFNDDPTGDF